MGDSIGGRGASSVGFQVAALNFVALSDDEVADAPARPAKPADPTTVASRNRAGSPTSFLLTRRRGCVMVVSVTAAQPLSRVVQPCSGVMSAATVLRESGTTDKTTAALNLGNDCVAAVWRMFPAREDKLAGNFA